MGVEANYSFKVSNNNNNGYAFVGSRWRAAW